MNTDHRTALARLSHRRFRPIPANRKVRVKAPAGLLGMLVLVAMVEFWVTRRGPALMDPVAYSWTFADRAAAQAGVGRNILCLGDSLAKHGLVPRVVESVTGRSAYNLAVAAGPVPVTYYVLRHALDAGARPSAVVFDLKPGMMIGGPQFSVRYWPRVLNPGETLGLIAANRNVGFATELLIGAILPTFRARHEVRGNILEAIRGEPPSLATLNALCRRNWTVNAGANLATTRPGYTGEVSEAEHREQLSRGFEPHRVNVRYAREVVRLATSHGIHTYLLIAPFVPQLQTRRIETGADAKYEAFVRSLQAEFPGLTVLDARDSGFPAEVFIDAIHLDARGAAALSLGVAEALRDDLAGAAPSRWIKLPRYRPVLLPEGAEDVETSRARITASLKIQG
jgi:hypothetical protein